MQTWAPIYQLCILCAQLPAWYVVTGLIYHSKINIDLAAVFTNTTAVDAYHWCGRPEATYLLERLLDLAAHEMNMDPAELRFKTLFRLSMV